MDDERWLIGGEDNDFQETTAGVRTDDESADASIDVLLEEDDDVSKSVTDVGFRNPMLSGAVRDLHIVIMMLTSYVNTVMTEIVKNSAREKAQRKG